jgi:epoxyqueuosine reductase QueG
VKFSRDATESAYAAREVIAGKDARTLATELLAMSQEEFSAAFRKSPVKRAKVAGLQRNARVVLANHDEP